MRFHRLPYHCPTKQAKHDPSVGTCRQSLQHIFTGQHMWPQGFGTGLEMYHWMGLQGSCLGIKTFPHTYQPNQPAQAMCTKSNGKAMAEGLRESSQRKPAQWANFVWSCHWHLYIRQLYISKTRLDTVRHPHYNIFLEITGSLELCLLPCSPRTTCLSGFRENGYGNDSGRQRTKKLISQFPWFMDVCGLAF